MHFHYYSPTRYQQFGGEYLDIVGRNITHLIFADRYNQPLSNLPSSLTFLQLGRSFSHPLTNLPPSLIHLQTGDSFDHPICHLPPTITSLHLGAYFNHQLIISLHLSLTLKLQANMIDSTNLWITFQIFFNIFHFLPPTNQSIICLHPLPTSLLCLISTNLWITCHPLSHILLLEHHLITQ
jgi:hypothetical protein